MYKYIKRTLDILLSLVLLIILFIPLLIISLLIKIEDKGPIFFKQKRTGINGKEFYLIKFRSMKVDNELKEKDEITKVGKFIRKTSIDELPQMINILKGDMSFIGPRPWIIEYYLYMNKEQKKRYSVLPGITGLAQVNGRDEISILEKISYDLKYIENYSFIQDLKIFFKTIYVLLENKNTDIGKDGIQKELKILKKQNNINNK